MIRGKLISINPVQGGDKNFIIRDENGINLGAINIIEYSKGNKNCTFRFEYYKSEDKSEYIKDALNSFIESLIEDLGIYKVNVIVREDVQLKGFIESGLKLEGVIASNLIKNGDILNEFIFGIDVPTYKKLSVTNIFRLQGENVELKILSPEDAEVVLDYYYRNKEYLKPFEPSRSSNFYTLDAQRRMLIEQYSQFLNGTNVPFGIFKDDKFIGKIQLSNIVLGAFRNAFVGYSIDEKEQGKGYMKEAVKLASEYAFEYLELHRLEATTLIDNIKSQKVLLNSGFKEIGKCERYLYINGVWRDHFVFYKTSET